VDHARGRAARAALRRVTPGVQAGTISVDLRPERDGTVADVRYELTALDPAADGELEAFAAGYDAYMAHWERLIAAALTARG
jgi:hypothetical protein